MPTRLPSGTCIDHYSNKLDWTYKHCSMGSPLAILTWSTDLHLVGRGSPLEEHQSKPMERCVRKDQGKRIQYRLILHTLGIALPFREYEWWQGRFQ